MVALGRLGEAATLAHAARAGRRGVRSVSADAAPVPARVELGGDRMGGKTAKADEVRVGRGALCKGGVVPPGKETLRGHGEWHS
ncbi:MAG: hypothetical protein M5U01_09190 [Ardenticatenaceae bacterium]|nr:hypothetical protein [Ardenticatenaceae bacterium]